MSDIYGSSEVIPDNAWKVVNDALENADDELYNNVRKEEILSNRMLNDFEKEYKGILKKDNVSEILKTLRQKEEKQDAKRKVTVENKHTIEHSDEEYEF